MLYKIFIPSSRKYGHLPESDLIGRILFENQGRNVFGSQRELQKVVAKFVLLDEAIPEIEPVELLQHLSPNSVLISHEGHKNVAWATTEGVVYFGHFDFQTQKFIRQMKLVVVKYNELKEAAAGL